MNKQQLDEIRERSETPNGVVEFFFTATLKEDIQNLLDYIDGLKEIVDVSSGACYTAAKAYGVIYDMQKKKIEELEKKLEEALEATDDGDHQTLFA